MRVFQFLVRETRVEPDRDRRVLMPQHLGYLRQVRSACQHLTRKTVSERMRIPAALDVRRVRNAFQHLIDAEFGQGFAAPRSIATKFLVMVRFLINEPPRHEGTKR